MKAIFTSTWDRVLELNYRLPNKQIMTVVIPAYALNQEFYFPNEELYEACKRQNAKYFEGESPVILEGKSSGAKAEKMYTEREKKTARKISAEVDAAVESITGTVEETGAKIAVTVESGGRK
jgi:hypothetical protein